MAHKRVLNGAKIANILLISSTISPKENTFLLKVTNARTRLEHYRSALSFYLKLLQQGIFDSIVYVDNSGFPLDELLELAKLKNCETKVEFISYLSDLSSENSRYFLEIHLIDFAMQNSKFINDAPTSTIWKVTGRYIVSNAAKIIQSWPKDTDLYINVRDFPNKTLDFYFVGYRCESYGQHIGHDLEQFRGTRSGELILREQIDANLFSNTSIVERFKITPRLYGVRGHDGATYGGALDTTKFLLRSAMNVLFPTFRV